MKPLILLLIISINGFPTERDDRKKAKTCKNYKTQTNWPTGHKGDLEFVVPENKDGWEIKLTFNKPCKTLQVSNAKTQKIGKGKVWMLTNMDWNKMLKAGETLKLRDILCSHKKSKKKNKKRRVIAAVMTEGIDICKNNENTTPTTFKPTEEITTGPQTTEAQITSTKPTETTCGARVESGHSWKQGQNGKLFITFPAAVTEWTVELVLDRKINKLDVYQGHVTTQNDLTYIIKNKNYNGENEAGKTLEITWKAEFDDGVGAPEVVEVSLVGVDCGAPIPPTTSSPSTLPASPTPTATPSPSTPPASPTPPPTSSPTTPPTPTGPITSSNCVGDVKYDENSWKEGMDGKMFISFNTDVMEWSFDVVFDKPINSFDVFNGVVTTEDDIKFTVRNKDYNGKQTAGTKIEFGWQARFDSTDQSPQMIFVCGSELGGTTPSPPTTSKSPTTPEPPITSEPSTTNPPPTTEISSTVGISSSTANPPTTVVSSTTPVSSTTAESSTTQESTTESCKVETKYDYGEVLRLSNLFYQAQRSGDLDALDDFNHEEIPYRGDSALDDGSDNGVDLTGGYYDAGDYVKFNFPMAAATTLLAWGAGSYKSGYETAGQYKETLNTVKWATDYFIKCHTGDNELWAQVGNGDADHAQWDRVEDMTIPRPSFKIDSNNPGSDLAGETAASLAAASIMFKEEDPAYSALLLTHAKQLYDFADTKRGKYSDSVPAASKFYNSWSGYEDELVWGAAWLYKATGDKEYLDKAEANYVDKDANEFAWDDKTAGAQIILAQETGDSKYVDKAKKFCDKMVDPQKKTPKGLVFIQQWGPLRHASNVAFACLQAAQIPELSLEAGKYREFAEKQINYALGDAGRSYVIGFGDNYPKKPHHRSSSCPKDSSQSCGWDAENSPNPNPSILWGALVGGPGEDDSYADDRSDYIKNEVACDYNAGFQSAVAGLRTLAHQGLLSGNDDQGCGGSSAPVTEGPVTSAPVTAGPGTSGGQDKVTAYGDAWQGNNCGFIKMPSVYAETYFVAMPNDYYNSGATCGACVRLSTPEKSLIVYGMNRCPECHYDPLNESHWDLSNSAYRFLIGEPLGIGKDVSHEIVPCPQDIISGNMEIYTKDGSNPYWNAFQPVNFRIPVDGMSLSTDGGKTWTALRGPGEHYVDGFYFLNETHLSGTYKLRIHSGQSYIDVDMQGVQARSFVDTGKQN